MKKAAWLLKKLAPAITACMGFILTFSANTTTCFLFHQPEAPKGLDDFKRIK